MLKLNFGSSSKAHKKERYFMLKYQAIDNQKEEWVVFIHGMGGSTRTWTRQIEAFSKSYNLLLLDLPGHGEHSNKIIYKVNSEELNQGIIETMNHLNISSAHFVALSLGTIVTANFAIHHPEYIKSIILGAASLKVSGIYKLAVIAANKFKKLLPYKFLYKFFVGCQLRQPTDIFSLFAKLEITSRSFR